VLRAVALSAQALQQQAHGGATHVGTGLVDRGEVDVAHRGQRRVVVAHQRHVLGHADAALGQRAEHAQRCQVVGDEDRARQRSTLEQRRQPAASAVVGVVARHHQRLEPAALHRALVAAAPLGRAGAAPAVDVCDARVPQPGQVLDDERRAGGVVVADAVDARDVRAAAPPSPPAARGWR
jgi:hypothetical protein